MEALARKVTAGVDKKGGDVDMFGHETKSTLEERMGDLARELELVETVQNEFKTHSHFYYQRRQPS